MRGAGKSRDLDFHDLVFVFGCVVGDEDFRRQFFIHGRDEEDLAIESQLPDDGVSRPLRYVDHAAFGASPGLAQDDFDLHLVAVHGGAGHRRRNEDVASDTFNLSVRE